MNSSVIPLDSLRTRLAVIWLIGAGMILCVAMTGSVFGNFGKSTQAVWEWLLPMITPTLGAIISTLAATALLQDTSKSEVRQVFSLTAEGLSIFYLLIIFSLLFFKQKIGMDTETWLATLHQSSLWLGPLQGLVASALGVVFISKKDNPGGGDAAGGG